MAINELLTFGDFDINQEPLWTSLAAYLQSHRDVDPGPDIVRLLAVDEDNFQDLPDNANPFLIEYLISQNLRPAVPLFHNLIEQRATEQLRRLGNVPNDVYYDLIDNHDSQSLQFLQTIGIRPDLRSLNLDYQYYDWLLEHVEYSDEEIAAGNHPHRPLWGRFINYLLDSP